MIDEGFRDRMVVATEHDVGLHDPIADFERCEACRADLRRGLNDPESALAERIRRMLG